MADTWFPKATRRDGPAKKQGYVSFPKRTLLDITGLVGHSMEGGLTAALGELDNPQRSASWPFSNPKVGPLLQHYPLESICWTNGSINSNFLFVGVEHEGVAGELINLNQRQNLADLLSWLDHTCPNIKGWERNRSLWEHRELTQFGSSPTACPSNRIPWAQVLALMEDDDMKGIIVQSGDDFYMVGPGFRMYLGKTATGLQDMGWPVLQAGQPGAPADMARLFEIPDIREYLAPAASYSFLAELGLEKKS